ncbi:unnamed protein product [Rhizophagus irregularis]|nr:unnamed protein product [Rhizophagus irregularis]
MSGNIVNRPRPNKCIDIILDKVYNNSVPKPINLCPGYDIEYIRNCYGFPYPSQFEKMVEVEKIYDNLSIISSYETPQQWAIRVKDDLQTLIAEGYRSFYHVFCLFRSFGQGVTKTYYNIWAGRELPISYHRPSVHKIFFLESRFRQIFWLLSRRKVLPETYGIPKLLGINGISELPGIFFFQEFSKTILLTLFKHMTSQSHFNEHYKSLLDQLPPSMKKDVWLRLTTRKNNPLSEEQAPVAEHEAHNNIKKTIEAQVAEERKRLKDEYDALMARKESEYNNCMVDMKQKIFSFKHQLEDQHKSHSTDLEWQYKSQITTLEKSIVVKDKEIGTTISQLKNDKKDVLLCMVYAL